MILLAPLSPSISFDVRKLTLIGRLDPSGETFLVGTQRRAAVRGNVTTGVEPLSDELSLNRREWLGLAAVALLGFILRAVMLGRAALWMDEMCFIIYNVGIDTNAIDAFQRHWQSIVVIGHMPLPGTLQNIWYGVLGIVGFTDVMHSPFLNRVPMLLIGTLSIPGTYLVSRAVLGRGATAWCIPLLVAASFYPVYYSREAYCYAYVLFFGAWAIAGWVRLYARGGLQNFLIAALAFAGMALSHLGAVVMVAGAAATAGVFWLVAIGQRETRPVLRNRFLCMLAPTLAFLVASPYLVRFMLYNTAHIGTGQAPRIWVVWNDAVNKMFLGEWPMLAALAWFVWGAGMISLVVIGWQERRNSGPLVAATVLAGMVLLGVATTRTQYLSARYFTPLAPAMYLVFGAGLAAIAGAVVARLPRFLHLTAGSAAIGLTSFCLITQIFYFLPLYWVLPNRQEPYDRAAMWMNGNLPPGTPYVLQNPYHNRWLGQFYPTPALPWLTPYVHAGPKDEHIERRKQVDICNRMPEAAYVRLCGVAGTEPEPPWDWPESRFRNRVRIDNPELRRLIRSGIFPGVPYEHVDDWDYSMDIFFNRRADRLDIARREAHGILFDFPDWVIQGQQISAQETLYFRVPKDAYRAFTLTNLNDHDVAGKAVIDFLIVGPVGQLSDCTVTLNDIEAKAPKSEHGRLTRINLEVPHLPTGENIVFVTLPGGDAAKTIAIWDVRWEAAVPGAGETPAKPAER